ncbi:MAG: D-glycero-beta-D-manno-heptose 1-phosphate adenylyltransferase [Nanoarchaeota archaeon]|nr:MAG: D-glycero-beta-D-manno-heptose 1-phosphate adenylyltransferase [Nanoarchaeota archaeon]
MMNKILKTGQLLKQLEKRNGKVVTTCGTFDILHAGHVDSLSRAKKLGDILVVCLNTDSSVKTNKGDKRPINSQNERAAVLAALECVDYIVFFSEKDPKKILSKIKPDIHVKGADRKMSEIIEKKIVEKNGGKVILLPYKKGFSTTEVIKRIIEAYGK